MLLPSSPTCRARQVRLGQQDVRLRGAFDRAQEVGHRGHLLELLLEEPGEELLADEVALGPGDLRQLLDLAGHRLLLLERHAHWLDRVRELVARTGHGWDGDRRLGVEQVLDDDHRVVPFLDRLAVEMAREERQGLVVVPDRDRDVLLRGAEFVGQLVVQLVGEGRHGRLLRWAGGSSSG